MAEDQLITRAAFEPRRNHSPAPAQAAEHRDNRPEDISITFHGAGHGGTGLAERLLDLLRPGDDRWMPAHTPGRDEEACTTILPMKTSQGKWPSNVETHEQAPPGSWAALPKAEFRKMLETDASSIVPVPVGRNSIYHYSCGQVHAPEDCRGPLKRGCISSCVFCGHTDHMTDHCPYIQLMPKNQHEVLRYYLHVYARQGLPPVASYISFENYKIGPGELSTIPVLSRFAARDYEAQQRESDKTRGRKYYWQTLDYSRIDTENELNRLPGPCPSLGRWATHGPLPLRESEIEPRYDERDYNKVQGWTPFNKWWTLFSNDHIPGPLPRQRVILPPWVTDHAGPNAGLIKDHPTEPAKPKPAPSGDEPVAKGPQCMQGSNGPGSVIQPALPRAATQTGDQSGLDGPLEFPGGRDATDGQSHTRHDPNSRTIGPLPRYDHEDRGREVDRTIPVLYRGFSPMDENSRTIPRLPRYDDEDRGREVDRTIPELYRGFSPKDENSRTIPRLPRDDECQPRRR